MFVLMASTSQRARAHRGHGFRRHGLDSADRKPAGDLQLVETQTICRDSPPIGHRVPSTRDWSTAAMGRPAGTAQTSRQRLVPVIAGAMLVVCALVLPLFHGGLRYHVVLTPFLTWTGMVWLLADRLARLRALLMLGAIAGLAGFAGALAALAMSVELFGGERIALEAFAVFAVVVHMGAMAGARTACRRQFTWRKFVRWALLWHLVLPQIVGLPCLIYGIVSGESVGMVLWGMLTVGGIAVWTLQTPLMGLLVMSATFRGRVTRLLRLPEAQA